MVTVRPNSKTDEKLPRTDITEKILRRRGFEVAVEFGAVRLFDAYNAGYLQALKDLEIDKQYIMIYKNVMNRVRKSYGKDRAFYRDIVMGGKE